MSRVGKSTDTKITPCYRGWGGRQGWGGGRVKPDTWWTSGFRGDESVLELGGPWTAAQSCGCTQTTELPGWKGRSLPCESRRMERDPVLPQHCVPGLTAPPAFKEALEVWLAGAHDDNSLRSSYRAPGSSSLRRAAVPSRPGRPPPHLCRGGSAAR